MRAVRPRQVFVIPRIQGHEIKRYPTPEKAQTEQEAREIAIRFLSHSFGIQPNEGRLELKGRFPGFVFEYDSGGGEGIGGGGEPVYRPS